MRIRNSIYYTAILFLFVTVPLLAAEPVSQIQSLQGRVWVQRGDANIEANSASQIHSGDSISTSETGRIATRLWYQLNFKLDISSKIVVISDTNQSDTPAIEKFIKLEYGAGCLEIDHVMDSPVLFQIGDRVTISFTKPVALCLSTDADISHIQLIKGRVELRHLADSMLIALNEPGSEIKFFNGGIFSLIPALNAIQPETPIVDLREFPKPEDLNELAKTEDSVEPPKVEEPKELSKTEDLKESSKTVDLKIAPKIAVPVVFSKTEDSKEPSKAEESQELSKAEDLNEAPNTEGLNTPSKITVPIALSNLGDSNEPAKVEGPKELTKAEGLKESSNTEDLSAPSKITVPIALSDIEDSTEPSITEAPIDPAKTKHSKELYNVHLSASRSYETSAAVNRRLRDSGYSSLVIDEIDNKGPLFRVSVPNFETITAARGFIDKVVVSLGIHDAWIERRLEGSSKTEDLKASPKKAGLKVAPKAAVPVALSKPEGSKESSKMENLKVPSKQAAPIVLSKAEDPKQSSKTNQSKELFNVYLSVSRSYEAPAEVNRRLLDSGYSSVVIDEIDNKGPLFRVSVPNFKTITAARGFIDKVVVSLGIHDAWIERYLKELSKSEVLNETSKTQAPKETSKAVDLEVAPKIIAPIALAKTEVSNKPAKVEEPKEPAITEAAKESSSTKNSQELFNVYLSASRSYETTAAINRRLRDTGYGSVVIDEIDSQGPLFRVSVPNFETITAARVFVDKVVVSLGIHDAWIERQRSNK